MQTAPTVWIKFLAGDIRIHRNPGGVNLFGARLMIESSRELTVGRFPPRHRDETGCAHAARAAATRSGVADCRHAGGEPDAARGAPDAGDRAARRRGPGGGS